MSTGPERFEGAQIYDASVRDLVNVPTAAERKEERVAVLLEGHAAGLHVMPAADCPDCPAVDVLPGDRQMRAAARALDRYTETRINPMAHERAHIVAGESFVQALGDYVLSRLHHNGDYGVAIEARTPEMRETYAQALQDVTPDPEYVCERFVPFDLGAPEHGTCGGCGARFAAHKPDYGAADSDDLDPCAGGRCSDPEAHAEGAHDV